MKKLHLIYIPFTGVGLYGGYRGDEWFKERIEIFKNYTLKSLANQSNTDFTIWCSFRPEEWGNPLVERIEDAITRDGLRCVFTYHGLMYWDDKFTRSFLQRVANSGRVIRQCWRNRSPKGLWANIREIFQDKNATLEKRIGRSLEELYHLMDDDQTVLLSRIDSDDMFHEDAIWHIQNIQEHTPHEAVGMTNGYIHNTTTGEIAEWIPETNPPFHTISFPSSVFFDAKKHLAHYRGFKSHEDITKLYDIARLVDPLYCVTTHNPQNHISTIWDHPFRGNLVDPSVLKEFGL